MQPILAERSPHAGRAIAFAAALAVAASLLLAGHARPSHRDHRVHREHHLRYLGKCAHAGTANLLR